MKLDPNHYRVALDGLRMQILDHRGRPHNRCSELAAVSGVPALAIVLYALRSDVIGPCEELQIAAIELHKFYEYDSVDEWNQ